MELVGSPSFYSNLTFLSPVVLHIYTQVLILFVKFTSI